MSFWLFTHGSFTARKAGLSITQTGKAAGSCRSPLTLDAFRRMLVLAESLLGRASCPD